MFRMWKCSGSEEVVQDVFSTESFGTESFGADCRRRTAQLALHLHYHNDITILIIKSVEYVDDTYVTTCV